MTQTDVRRRTGEVKSDICYWQKINYGWHKLKTRIIRNGLFTMVKHEFWKHLKLAHDVLDSSNSMEGPEIIENISDMTESEKEKKKAEVTIFTAKCNAAIDVVKELEALRIKAERKHRETEKQYEAFCKRNGINNE